MRKYLAAATMGALLMAGQAAAYDNGVVSVGDRIGAQSAASDRLEGEDASVIYFVVAGALMAGIIGWLISSGSPGTPGSP